ncbi:L-histidine N(alpha)-methyltransferase [Pseudonocardia sp. NPDC049635]|uniref:L-histidine N(alpha)-methyltransferase n=1 Tax=Pseudonocardia sp. NPDC049635 TaxID=3155506 RepID=UPI0033F2F31B
MSVVELESGAAFFDDVAGIRACLTEPLPRIPPWFGYDERGSELFEQITELPTYYLTRVEWALLRRHGADIAARLGCPRVAELGSGSAKKTRLLLAECAARRPTHYLPVDVSREMLEHSADRLGDLPGLSVTGLWGRYEAGLDRLHDDGGAPLAVLFLGANVGNTTPGERSALLARIAAALRPGDAFAVSADLLKPAAVFETCYNDPPGYSAFADFRLNHLAHLARRFGGQVELDDFRAAAHYDPDHQVVDGRLWARRDRSVELPVLGLSLDVRRGEGINVGFSAKFDRDGFRRDVEAHGLRAEAEWVDDEAGYGIFLFRR